MANQKFTLKILTIGLLAATLLSPILFSTAQAESSTTVGEWKLDETNTIGTTETTPDQTGVNHGILAGAEHPTLVEGKYGNAMKFNGENAIYIPIKFIIGFPPMDEPMYVPISTNLDIAEYFTIDAWINVPGFKNATYNNIVVKCNHPDQAAAWQNTTRVLGLALRAGTPENGEEYVEGALSGFVMTETGGVNEIVTTQTVPLNTWIEVQFTRDLTGLHLYINNQEQTTKTLSGTHNPTGKILNGTEYYFGHDSYATIDTIKLTDLAPNTENAIEIGPNLMIVIIVVSLIFAVAWLLRRGIQLWIIRPKV
ncbi:MAG TPA: LamG-like jellyroll fold domain-containing protein [Candidatus Acidoferrales bacterium]|nr:LamG-like jellyroll fold domain-containing protein [Candidatus Acidoferrales bacterium]